MSESSAPPVLTLHIDALLTSAYLLILAEGVSSVPFSRAWITRDSQTPLADRTAAPQRFQLRFEQRAPTGEPQFEEATPFRTGAVFRYESGEDRRVLVSHAGGEMLITAREFPENTFRGLQKLLNATVEAQRDGIHEGLGFSLGMDFSEALQDARADLCYVLRGDSSATAREDLSRLPGTPFIESSATETAALAESGILNALGDTPVLYVRLRLTQPDNG